MLRRETGDAEGIRAQPRRLAAGCLRARLLHGAGLRLSHRRGDGRAASRDQSAAAGGRWRRAFCVQLRSGPVAVWRGLLRQSAGLLLPRDRARCACTQDGRHRAAGLRHAGALAVDLVVLALRRGLADDACARRALPFPRGPAHRGRVGRLVAVAPAALRQPHRAAVLRQRLRLRRQRAGHGQLDVAIPRHVPPGGPAHARRDGGGLVLGTADRRLRLGPCAAEASSTAARCSSALPSARCWH